MLDSGGVAPVVAVLCGNDRPTGMASVENRAEVRYATAGELPEALRGADALFVWDFLSTAVESAFPVADRLRWVHIASAGVDTLLFPALRDSGIPVTNSRGIFDQPIAEYVLGVLLAFAKDLPGSLAAQRENRWHHRESERITGRRVLVVGTGPIGRAIAVLLRAVGMRVAGAGRRARADDPDFGVVHDVARLTEHLADADFVLAVAPLTPQTRGMFDSAAFAAMKPGARFVNVGRGALVVTDDLVDALRRGVIAGAALDVFEVEPLPHDSPLWTLQNVLVSPHMSGDFVGWRPALAELFVDNFERWQAGSPLHNVVDMTIGYVPTAAATG